MSIFPDKVYSEGNKELATKAYVVEQVQDYTILRTPSPVPAGITIDAAKKVITIPFDFAIFRYGTVAAQKALVQIATDGVTFGALAAADTVTIDAMNLVITLDSALTLATNKIRLGQHTVQSAYGVTSAQYTTPAISAA